MLSPDGDGQPGEQTLGQFALVSYIPDPLARFLDDLRMELTPGCNPRAHVTILPPRPLDNDVDVKDTVQLLVEECRNLPPFRVEPGDIRVFEESNVVYLDIARGIDELTEFYRVLNRGPLEYKESFPYHPHITIAQNIAPDQAPRLAAARRNGRNGISRPARLCGFFAIVCAACGALDLDRRCNRPGGRRSSGWLAPLPRGRGSANRYFSGTRL